MKFKSLVFAMILCLSVTSNAQKKTTTGSAQPASQTNVDKYSADYLFRIVGNDARRNPDWGRQYFWVFNTPILNAFREGKTDMKSYIREWSRVSGLSETEINHMITDIYVYNQLAKDVNSNSDQWSKNQLTMKGFGLSSSLNRDDAELIASAEEEKGKFSKLSDYEKLALLNRLPKQYLEAVLSNSNILVVEAENPAIANWIKENANEKVKDAVAQSILARAGGLKFDPSYIDLLDPSKMNDYAKCNLVLTVKESIEKQRRLCTDSGVCDSISPKFRASLQNKLNYFPSKMKCWNSSAKEIELSPSTLLDEAMVKNPTSARNIIAPVDRTLKSAKCGMQKSDTVFEYFKGLREIAKTLFRGPQRGERSMSYGTNGDTSNCLFMSTLKRKKNGEIELQVSGIGKDNPTEVNNFKFKDKIDFELYIASLEADAVKKLKGSGTASPAPVTNAAPVAPRVNANPWVNK